MSDRRPVRQTVSAGGVIWRRSTAGSLEVVLCARPAERLWVLPKGTPDPGETLEDTAAREAREETGLAVRLTDKIGSIDYWFATDGVRYHKYVHHWLMEPVGGSVDDHDHEFDVVAWVPVDLARERLTYANERRVLEDAERLLED